MVSDLQLSGYVKVKHWRKGTLLYAHEGKNTVTEDAFEQIAQILSGGAVVLPSHIAVGNDGALPNPSQTVLSKEETSISRAVIVKTLLGRQVTYTVVITASAPFIVRECGIFDAATAGIMWARFLTGQISFIADDSLDIEWELTVGNIV